MNTDKIMINRRCQCGKLYVFLPEKHLVVNDGDIFDGTLFTCDQCLSTMLIPRAELENKEAA